MVILPPPADVTHPFRLSCLCSLHPPPTEPSVSSPEFYQVPPPPRRTRQAPALPSLRRRARSLRPPPSAFTSAFARHLALHLVSLGTTSAAAGSAFHSHTALSHTATRSLRAGPPQPSPPSPIPPPRQPTTSAAAAACPGPPSTATPPRSATKRQTPSTMMTHTMNVRGGVMLAILLINVVGGRGFHSSTFSRLIASNCCGTCWVASVCRQ